MGTREGVSGGWRLEEEHKEDGDERRSKRRMGTRRLLKY
jgi:hypothetical protein